MIFKKNWTKKEQAEFLIHVGECLSDGYPLELSIRLQLFNQSLPARDELEMILERLKNGSSFLDALSNSGFPREISSSIYFSEASGKLARGMIEAGRMMERREEYKKKLSQLLRYPIMLLWILTLMFIIVGHFLLPSFSRLYQTLSIDLPVTTKLIIYLTDHSYFLIVLLGFAVVSFTLTFFHFRRLSTEKQLSILIHFPLAASFTRHYITYHFSFYIGSLLRAGLSIRQAVETLSEKGTTAFLKYEATRIRRSLLDGIRFEKIVLDSPFYLPELATVLYHGQLNSIPGEALCKYSIVVMDRMERRIHTFLSVLQPALLLIIGGLVLGMFASVLLPVFQMVNGL